MESSLNSEGGRTSSCYFNGRGQTGPHQDRRSPVSGFKQPPRARLSSVLSLSFSQTDQPLTALQTTPAPRSLPRKPKAQTFVPDARRRCTRRRSVSEPERWERSTCWSLSVTQRGCLCHRRSTSTSLLSPISPGIKAASAAESVAKASSPRPSLTETGRYSVKVCIQRDLKSF